MIVAALVAVLAVPPSASAGAAGAGSAAVPWLEPRAGALARVDAGPWSDGDEPEAALAASRASVAGAADPDAPRPGDVVYRPIGALVRVVRTYADGTALVHGMGAAWEAYAPLARLLPAVPPGTHARVAGGFGGYAALHAAIDGASASGPQLPTGTRVDVLGTGVAPARDDVVDPIRVRVRVADGALAGRTGWIGEAYVGVPVARVDAAASIPERECRCRLARYR